MDIAWIAVDWGTTNVRAWAIGADHEVRHHAASDWGMAKLARHEFEPALLDLVGGWLATEGRTLVIPGGMVGASMSQLAQASAYGLNR